MSRPDFHQIYDDPLDAECCAGYYDGRLPDSPEPGANRHPAYVHGFLNGRDDLHHKPRKSAQAIRDDWAYIEATCDGAAP